MFKIKLQLCLFLMFNYFYDGAAQNYSPYDNKHHHLLQTTNAPNDGYDTQQPASNENPVYQQNLQGNSNYQQMYRYYYTPPYQQQQRLLPNQPTPSWFGPPIVVEDDKQQQQQSATNIPPTLYQQHSTSQSTLPYLHRNSKILTPSVYNPQPTAARTTQFYYNNDNNNNNNDNNIVYHKDFRHQIVGIPESQHAQDDIVSLNNQHQLLVHQHQQQQQQQPQQFYATNKNLPYNGISNGLTSLRNDKVSDYREHFKRYLENNPHRIKPIY